MAYEKGERLNFLTHASASLLAVSAAAWMIYSSWQARTGVLFAIIGYSTSLVAMFVGSAAYHAAKRCDKELFRVLDYCLIYLFIAATYTPFAVISLPPFEAITTLIGIWSAALIGVATEILFSNKSRWLSLLIFVGMGWSAVLFFPYLSELSRVSFNLLLAGGVLYTVGIVFFVIDEHWWLGHPIWHVCVVTGSGAHCLAIYKLL